MPPTLAARWMTTCAPRRASKQAARSRRSYPAERTTVTSAARSSSIATVRRPRKPAPPVTTTVLLDQNAGSGLADAIADRLASDASGGISPTDPVAVADLRANRLRHEVERPPAGAQDAPDQPLPE